MKLGCTLCCVLGVAASAGRAEPGDAGGGLVRTSDPIWSALTGKYLCYAMLALAVDLVWGYAGILSLGHAAFFALGGYAMGMYLMREIGARGVYGNAILPDFMVFLGWKQLPWYWYGFNHFAVRGRDGAAGPVRAGSRVRLAGVPRAGLGRVSVDHHPGADLCADAGVLPQRHGVRRQ